MNEGRTEKYLRQMEHIRDIYLNIYTYTLHPDTAMNRRVGKIAIIDTPDTIITTKANLIKTADIYIHALG
jgi:hypothetical protein